MEWTFNPLGWGEGHEMGHNMQMSLLQINYASSAGPDKWSSYTSTAAENSNNIFPSHNIWRYWRIVKNYNQTLVDKSFEHSDWNGHKEAFTVLQSSIARINATVNGAKRAVSLSGNCAIKNNFPLGASPAKV